MVLVILLTIGVGQLSLWNGDAMLGIHFNLGMLCYPTSSESCICTDPFKYSAICKQIFQSGIYFSLILAENII